MNRLLVWQLAWRYMRGKRSRNIVPVLARISMVAIAVGSCAMIILLSVFNGFEYIVKDMYKAFYPDIKITAEKGKFFTPGNGVYASIKNINGVVAYTNVIEDNVFLKSEDDQRVPTLKGVDANYFVVNDVKSYIVEGSDSVSSGELPTTIVGQRLMNELGLDPNNVFSNVMLYYPNPSSSGNATDLSAFQSLKLRADGAFKVQDEFDEKYMLASLSLAQQLFHAEGKYSSIELKLDKNADADNIKAQLQNQLGGAYHIETRFEQNKTIYMVMRTEKWALYAILLMVLIIASFNMVGALSLLVLEKEKDIATLKVIGAQNINVRSVFLAEGILWALTGGLIGLICGTLIALGQQHYHWIKLQGAYVIDSYPVHFKLSDFPLVILTIILIGLLAAFYPARKAMKVDTSGLRSN
ncbi:MAG: ABC transporter permease [Bacteroidetes bacterium]|nr:ABC transporter permease [Bacteroidota bacterium]